MKERGILMSGPMVRAVLEGRKTMTRRIAKPFTKGAEIIGAETDGVLRYQVERWPNGVVTKPSLGVACKYGQPGDRLYVKEAAWMWCERRPNGTTSTGRARWLYVPMREAPVFFAADGRGKPQASIASPHTGNTWGWRLKVARFLPRWASRLALEITGVRVERLQDISEDDAKAEGAEPDTSDLAGYSPYKSGFAYLWQTINGQRGYGWDANPWVWCIGFRALSVGDRT